jgi:hypothetical protein
MLAVLLIRKSISAFETLNLEHPRISGIIANARLRCLSALSAGAIGRGFLMEDAGGFRFWLTGLSDGELPLAQGVEHGHHMTPAGELPGFLIGAGFSGQVGNQMAGNEIANLPKCVELAAGWNDFKLIHPYRAEGANKNFQPLFSILWDGSGLTPFRSS